MYKRTKRSRFVSLTEKVACASTSNRENIVNESGISTTNSNDSKEEDNNFKSDQIVNNFNEYDDFNNLFNLFSDIGMDIEAEPSNILKTDQAVFIRTLSSKLCSNKSKLYENINKFMKNFQNYCINKQNFLKMLSPTVTSSECDIARSSTQDSLIRLLLQIEELQTELSSYLLDKLGELAFQSDDLDSEMTSITWVRLILQPFRYLNSIVNSEKLCERLFDIVFSCPDRVIQQEVIICLPDIIADSEHHFAAIELSKLLKGELELMPSILDALTNLSVQTEIREDVRCSLIGTLKSSPIEYLPNIVKFLLCTCDSNSYDEVINGLRNELFSENSVSLKNTLVEENIDVENIQILVFNNVRNCLLANKQLADSWIKIILQINSASNSKCLDLLVTLILYDICIESTKKRSLETLFRNRIKSGFFNVLLIDKIFEHFIPVVIEYFPALMCILSKLLKSVDTCITEFVSAFYLACFENNSQQWCKVVLKELLAYIGAGDVNDAQTALTILSAITVKYYEKIKPLSSMLRVLLNKLEDLPLTDVQRLMDMLCYLAFTDLNDDMNTSLLKLDITNLIEKQIGSSSIKLVRIGILSAVMAIKHMASHSENESNAWPDKSSDDFEENSLSEKAKKALPFLRLIIDGTRIIPEAQGFGFDQFSLMLMHNRNFDKSLMFYISMIMKENMKKYFLICSDEVRSITFLECSLKFGLNEDEEFVVLNLTPTLIEELNSNIHAGFRMYSLILPSLLRLIRSLEYEDLREIDGLLECPVIVPAPNVIAEFSLQSPEIQVLVRLRTLIWLQNLIAKYLPQMLSRDYCPPKCHFYKSFNPPTIGTDKKKKKLTEKKKANESKTPDIRKHFIRNGTQSTVTEESDDEFKENEKKSADIKNYKQFFRDLDLNIWIMLSLPLTLNPEPEKDWEFKPEFGPSELLFIMEDLIEKVHFVLISSAKKNPFKNSVKTEIEFTSSSLYISAPEVIAKNVIKLIPRLRAHMETVSKFCRSLLTANDNIFDSTGMFSPESQEIKLSYTLILKVLCILFGWSGFEESSNHELFIVGLTKLGVQLDSVDKSTSKQVLIKECVKYLSEFEETVLNLECAINLVTLMEILIKNTDQKELNKILANICWNYLSHHWYDWNGCEEKGAAFNKNIEYLITTFFNCSNNKLKAVQSMAECLKTEINTLNNKDSSLNALPNINKGNLNILLRVLMKILTNAIKQTLENNEDPKEKLSIWLKVMNTMDSIVTILKNQTARVNLICFVKGSAGILRLFLNQGIVICSRQFRTESNLVSQILKTLQITTRYLQKIFDNTKLNEDSTLCSYLPSIRSLLESILLKVKNIMVLNGCTEAFFVGSMRNKDLQGQDILSQSTVNDDSERMDIDENEHESDTRSTEIEDNLSTTEKDNTIDQNNDDDINNGYESEVILENESESDDAD
ncbi:hypothetical protein PGB90_010161 [Kerria lacca]